MIEKEWIQKAAGDEQYVQPLQEELKIREIIAKLLVQRNIHNYHQAKSFFRPQIEDLHDPFEMKGMQEAIDRIRMAQHQGEKVMIYGDYDVDGTTSVAMAYDFFKRFFTNDLEFYIPDRYAEGYGVSKQGIEYAHHQGITLIVTFDCGIRSVELVDFAQRLGIDFIICDHHLPGAEIPRAVAVLDPKQPGCNYPFKELSGCGVGFKLIQGFAQEIEWPEKKLEKYLEYVSVSIASDIVPIVDENRILAYFGFKKLNENPETGLKYIVKENFTVKDKNNKSTVRNISTTDIVFGVGPKINAAGRIKDAKEAVNMLLATNDNSARSLYDALDVMNQERRNIDENITHEAIKMVESNPEMQARKSKVLFNENWHKGVVGIVASRIVEKYYQPTIILTENDGKITGSARSIEGFDIHSALESCADILDQFGGHTHAAGLALKRKNLDEFIARFESITQERLCEDVFTPKVHYSLEISLSEVDDKLLRILSQFAPFGPGNLTPLFLSKRVADTGFGRTIGRDHKHLRMDVLDENRRTPLVCIGFGLGDKYNLIKDNQYFDMIYSIETNFFRGKAEMQLQVRDIRKSEA